MTISIVVPVFNEKESIVLLYREIKAVLENVGFVYEIIFVDDGSTDGSKHILQGLAQCDATLIVVSFSSNCGQAAALQRGIEYAVGETIILMDGDLQNDPRDIPLLIHKLNEGFDLVSGWRIRRKDSFLGRCLPSACGNRLISFLTGVPLHDFGCTLKAYRARLLKNIKLYGRMHRFIPVFIAWGKAKISEVPVNHRRRLYGKSKYTLRRIPETMYDLFSMSLYPKYYKMRICGLSKVT